MMKKFVTFLKRHKICLGVIAFFIFLCKGFLLFWVKYAFVNIVTPIRCQQWAGKELEVFLTPEEWRKEAGVQESLKDTKWIYYYLDEEDKTNDNFKMLWNDKEHWLLSFNEKYPNLKIYTYIDKRILLGRNSVLLYDQNLDKLIMKYNEVVGYVTGPINGFSVKISCKNNSRFILSEISENYLN